MLDFASLESAQRWLDAQPNGRALVKPWQFTAASAGLLRTYRQCQDEALMCVLFGDDADWTRLKMASRRLSMALGIAKAGDYDAPRSHKKRIAA